MGATVLMRDKEKSSEILFFINIIGLFTTALSPVFFYFSQSELNGFNSFLLMGIILVIASVFIGKAHFSEKLLSILMLITIVAYYNLFSGNLFETAVTKDIILSWLSFCFLTGIWRLRLEAKVAKFFLLSALAVLCLTYFGFRVFSPEAGKTDFVGANFIGLCAVLMIMVSLKCFNARSISAQLGGILCLLISVSGAFASSSRFALIVVAFFILFVVLTKLTRFRPAGFIATLTTVSGTLLFVLIALLFVGDDFGNVFTFANQQWDHIVERLGNLTPAVFEGTRVSQIFDFLGLLDTNPSFLFFPLPEVDFTASEKGFSDNSLFELAGYTGFLPSILIFLFLMRRLFQQMTGLDASVCLLGLLSFNVLLMVPFAALLHMFLLAFPVPRVRIN